MKAVGFEVGTREILTGEIVGLLLDLQVGAIEGTQVCRTVGIQVLLLVGIKVGEGEKRKLGFAVGKSVLGLAVVGLVEGDGDEG